jgi:cytochrome c peroxidase
VDEATGAAVFVKAGCARCHEGAQMGSRSSLSVGLGEAFQVPSLVGVSRRGPWMHDGCAKTLRERFTNEACGGPRHGEVSNLAPGELDTLIAWLETR